MESITPQPARSKLRPIIIGLFAVAATVSAGMTLAVVTGFANPEKIMAQIVQPPCCVVTPTPPVVVPPPPPPVVPPPIVQPPCCTEVPVPPVTPPVVPPPPPIVQPPCCTEVPVPPVTPPIVTPPVVVPPVIPPVVPPLAVLPQCVYLTASATTITPGQAVTLSWKTVNATSISINQGIGSVTPVAQGSVVVNPTQNTTYVATVANAEGSVNCDVAVTVSTNPPPAQCVFLTGTPNVINAGDAVKLSWKTVNANSISINNGVGSVTPVAEGSTIVHPTQNTTYVATVTGATGSVNCQTSVTVTTVQQGPKCVSLTANRTRISSGDAVVLTWATSNASSVSIDNGVGSVTPVDGGSVTVNPTSNTTYTATVPNAPSTTNCQVTVEIENPSCTSNCGGGGGGGGGRRSARVGIDSYVPDLEEPLSFVYLSETPYTGLDLGPWGTALYWVMLFAWSAAAAYLVLFNAVPFALARVQRFGGSVKEALNNEDSHGSHDTHVAHSAPAAHAPHGHAPAHAPAPAPVRPTGYSQAEGFRSFAAGEGLTIDDIVKGLSRQVEQNHDVVMQSVQHEEAPAAPAPVMAAPAPRMEAPAPKAVAPMNENVRDFIAALLGGDRDTVFGTIRKLNREGEDTEAFVSHAACALDDAYRACIDGTTCHPDIAELTQGCHPSFLERMVSSLSTAVDGSYSTGITGVKMALTRALNVAQG